MINNQWINEHGLDLIGYTLLAWGVALIATAIMYPENNDGGILGWILNL